MRSYFVWLILLPTAVFLIWQLQVDQPVVSRVVSGIALATVGFLAGLRVATDSASRFLRDVKSLNKYLADQNHDLAEMNLLLLQQFQFLEEGPEENSPEEEQS